MYYVADTGKLVAEGVINAKQAEGIKSHARSAMITLCNNGLLIAGILAATSGFVQFLGTAFSVAICGGLFLVGGLLILGYLQPLFRMFGNASALIGAGMLISGTGIELTDKVPDAAGPLMLAIGAIIAAICHWRYKGAPSHLRFAYGATLLMGAALHLAGAYFAADHNHLDGWPMPFVHFYVAATLVVLGLYFDVRVITALAIIPFAQMLDTGTFYRHAMYAFYSKESTLSILQMGALVAACLWVAPRWNKTVARQVGTLAIMGLVVANLCFLAGSILGDVVGETLWKPTAPKRYTSTYQEDREAYMIALEQFKVNAISIHEHVFSAVWAALLAALIIWAAFRNKRGMFNTGMTFAGIHAYTQIFESYHDEPLAYAIGGLLAIPLAFGLWRLNTIWFEPNANGQSGNVN